MFRDGRKRITVSGTGESPEELRRRIAHRALRRGPPQLIREQGDRTGSLAGKRIVVTQAAHQSKSLTDRLRELGAQPVDLPLIRMERLEKDDRLRNVIHHHRGYDWIVFTSANAVAFWWELAPFTTKRLQGVARVAAVGSKTAAVLEARGVEPALTPREFAKEKLVESLGEGDEETTAQAASDSCPAQDGSRKLARDPPSDPESFRFPEEALASC